MSLAGVKLNFMNFIALPVTFGIAVDYPVNFLARLRSEPERARLTALVEWGLTDLFRQLHPEATRVYSWWDYRAGDFHQGRGMRIDLALGSASVAARCEWAVIDRNARKGDKPSDHAPVVVDLS